MATTISYSSVVKNTSDNEAYNAVLVSPPENKNVWYLTTSQYTDQSCVITLDGVDYGFRFRWNTRDESWQIILSLAGGEPSCTFKCTNGIDLLLPYKYLDSVPDGELYIIDTVKINGRPDFGNTGVDKRFTFAYVDAKDNQS